MELYKEELYLVTQAGALSESSSYEDAHGDRVIHLSALDGRKFVLMKNGHNTRTVLNAFFEFNGIQPDIFMETSNNGTALGLASTGFGFAIVPRMYLDSQIAPHPIDIYRLSENGLCSSVTAITNADEPEKYLATRCIELIREVYSKQ